MMGSPVDKEGEALIEGMGVAHQARRHGPNITDHGV
jgi:maltooligosyltrehalose trehalohydrolase